MIVSNMYIPQVVNTHVLTIILNNKHLNRCSVKVSSLLSTMALFIPLDISWPTTVIGASLSEPLSVELAGAFLWYIFLSMDSPFGPRRVCHVKFAPPAKTVQALKRKHTPKP